MSQSQSQSDQNFKIPQLYPQNMQTPSGYSGNNQNAQEMPFRRNLGRGFGRGRGFGQGSPGNYLNRYNSNQGERVNESGAPPGRGRRDRSSSGRRHRSGSSGRDGERYPNGDGSSGRNRSRDRQNDNGNERRQSQEQWENNRDQSQQQNWQLGNSRNYRGQGQSRQNYFDQNDYGYSKKGGGYYRDSEKASWGRGGGGYSSYGQTPNKNYYGRDEDSDVFLSKTLSSILRHNAERFGFKLMKGGFLYVDEILNYTQKLHGYTLKDVRRIVESNDKKRFALEEENGRVKIRANQGHSLEVEALDLQPILSADAAPAVIHGTYYSSWELIKKTGLHRMNRNHIHFAAGEPGQNGVISGMRKTCEVMIYIDMEKALKDGLKFFRSANNVILCEGDKDGIIYPCYFSGALDRHYKCRMDFDHTINSSTAGEKPPESKKRKKKNKGKNKQEDSTENVEEVAVEPKSKDSEDGGTTDDSSIPVAKKQHVSEPEPSDKPVADISVAEGPSENVDEDIEWDKDEEGSTENVEEVAVEPKSKDFEDSGTTDDSSIPAAKRQHVSEPEPSDKPVANISVAEGPSENVDEDIESEKDEDTTVKSEHWNNVKVVEDMADSKEIVEHLCSNPPSFIAVCCVGQNLGTERSQIQAIVISSHPDSYLYYLHDEKTRLVKEGNLEQLLLNKDIHKVFHDIGAVSTSLINEYDILMNGIPIWDIEMLFKKVTAAKMDLEELHFNESMFTKWTKQNEQYGKTLAAHYDQAVVSDLVDRGRLMWDLHKLCFKKVDERLSKKLKQEVFQAAIPSDANFISEKIKKLKLEKKGKQTAVKTEEKSQQQQQQQQQQQTKQQQQKGKSGRGKGKGKKNR